MDKILGEALPDWTPPPHPDTLEKEAPLKGLYAQVEPLSVADHCEDLFEAYSKDTEGSIWDYLYDGPFTALDEVKNWLMELSMRDNFCPMVLRNLETGTAQGIACFMRIDEGIGSIEVGTIVFSPELQKTTCATEAIYLMMKWAFEVGYRRCEWKCNALNLASRSAALRYGFSFEGIFRQATIVKGHNRDTAWFSIIDKEWPELQKAFEAWLDRSNFDEKGAQLYPLSHLMKEHKAT